MTVQEVSREEFVDRANVVKGLELCSNILGCIGNVNPECPYALRDGTCRRQALLHDALALIREQESVDHALEVLKVHRWIEDREPRICENYGECLFVGKEYRASYLKYCPNCGMDLGVKRNASI